MRMAATSELEPSVNDEEVEELINKYFITHLREGFYRWEGTHLPQYFKEFSDDILKFQVRDDDIWVCSFPKAGTTWTQEMVWCIANNLDLEGAKVPLHTRFPYFEASSFINCRRVQTFLPGLPLPRTMTDSFGHVKELPSPRFIKTHLPFHLLPLQLQQGTTKAKIVYVGRNAKDVCVSFYYHNRTFEACKASLEEFTTLFVKDAVLYAPFWRHIFGFWEKRHEPNILFLKYEDLMQNLPLMVHKTASFLGKTLAEAEVDTLCKHLSFEKMRTNRAVNYEDVLELSRVMNIQGVGESFMRTGRVGDWKSHLSQDCISRFDQWIEENLKSSDLVL